MVNNCQKEHIVRIHMSKHHGVCPLCQIMSYVFPFFKNGNPRRFHDLRVGSYSWSRMNTTFSFSFSFFSFSSSSISTTTIRFICKIVLPFYPLNQNICTDDFPTHIIWVSLEGSPHIESYFKNLNALDDGAFFYVL